MIFYLHDICDDHRTRLGANRRNSDALADVAALLESRRADAPVLLTADDGYASVPRIVPLLEQYEARLILFVTTDFAAGRIFPYEIEISNGIEQRVFRCDPEASSAPHSEAVFAKAHRKLKRAPIKRREAYLEQLARLHCYDRSRLQEPCFLDWEGIKELARHPLVEIGSHTVSHLFLPACSPVTLLRELRQSKSELEARLGKPVTRISYPYGASNRWVRAAAWACGYRFGYTTERPGRPTRMSIPRYKIDPAT